MDGVFESMQGINGNDVEIFVNNGGQDEENAEFSGIELNDGERSRECCYHSHSARFSRGTRQLNAENNTFR